MLQFFSLFSALIIFYFSFSPTFSSNTNDSLNAKSKSEGSFTQSSTAPTINQTYCTGIRGNGELAPAHWASLAKIIETKQAAPVGGAGGSSGSITMFILDNFYNSPLIYKDRMVPDLPVDREGLLKRINLIDHNKLAFLFKFLPHFFNKIGALKVNEYSQFLTLKESIAKLKAQKENISTNKTKEEKELQAAREAFASNAEELLDDKPTADNKASKGKLAQLKTLIKTIKDLKSIKTEEGKTVKFFKLYFEVKKAKYESNFLLDEYYLQWDTEVKKIMSSLKSISALNNFKERNKESTKKLKLLIVNFKEAISVFGKFDVDTDHNLFFRPGLVDFEKIGYIFNGMLSFFNHQRLSGEPARNTWEYKMHSFFDNCSVAAQSNDWISKKSKHYDGCMNRFNRIIEDYFKTGIWKTNKNPLIDQQVGQRVAAIVTTSVIMGDSYSDTMRLRNDFISDRNLITKDIANYVIDNKDLYLGYWYNREYTKLESNMKDNHDDEKSRRFLDLGNVAWKKVFATSPAEPGLTNFRPFESSTQGQVLSSGGWSDLHPVIVLKELEDKKGKPICDQVYYVTRKGGSSNFGRKLILKLIGPENKPIVDRLGNWNKTSPKSSFRKSADIADEVYCTNWNDFNVLAGEGLDLFKDSYHNSWFKSDKQEDEPKVVGCW